MAKRGTVRAPKRSPADAFAWETAATYRDDCTLKARAGFKGLHWLSTVRIAEHDGRTAVEPNEQATAAREALNARSLVEHGASPEQAALAAARNEAFAERYEAAAIANRMAEQYPAVQSGEQYRAGQHAKARRPRGDKRLAGIIKRLTKRDDTAKELWAVLLDRLDAAGCRPEEHTGSKPRRWRIDYTDTDGRGRHVTLDGLARMLRKNRKTQ